MDIAFILDEVYELLQNETRWCQEALAQDCDNLPIQPQHPLAVQWCLYGAVQKVCPDFELEAETLHAMQSHLNIWNKAEDFFEEEPDMTIEQFNDIANHEDILEFLDTARKKIVNS